MVVSILNDGMRHGLFGYVPVREIDVSAGLALEAHR